MGGYQNYGPKKDHNFDNREFACLHTEDLQVRCRARATRGCAKLWGHWLPSTRRLLCSSCLGGIFYSLIRKEVITKKELHRSLHVRSIVWLEKSLKVSPLALRAVGSLETPICKHLPFKRPEKKERKYNIYHFFCCVWSAILEMSEVLMQAPQARP